MIVTSGPRAGPVREVPDVTMGDHFGRVAAAYESLRTTDEAPVRTIGQFLPDRPQPLNHSAIGRAIRPFRAPPARTECSIWMLDSQRIPAFQSAQNGGSSSVPLPWIGHGP